MVATTTASTPSPTVAWNNQYSGAASYTVAKAVNQTTDGNYVIVGVTNGDDNMEAQFKYHYNIYLAGIDSGGNELWHNFYGMTGQPGDSNYETSSGNDVRQTSDGGYIITGQSNKSACLFKITKDADDTPQWSKKYQVASVTEGIAVRPTSDGGYVLLGNAYTNDTYNSTSDILVIKTDANGNTVWSKTFGGANKETAGSIQQTSDGGYIIVGTEQSFTPQQAIYLIKTDSNGVETWSKSFSEISPSGGYAVQQTSDGGYIATGGYNDQFILLKTDANGEKQWVDNHYKVWDKTYQLSGYGRSVDQASDGGYIVSGWNHYNDGGSNMTLFTTDANGNMLAIINVTTNDYYNQNFNGIATKDGGYIMVGGTQKGNNNNPWKALVVKFNNVQAVTAGANQSHNGSQVTTGTGTNQTGTAANGSGNASSTPKSKLLPIPGMEGILAIMAILIGLMVLAYRKK